MERIVRERFSPISVVTAEILENVFDRLDDATDRNRVSEVSDEWMRVDSMHRKEVKIRNCYSVAPSALSRRFPNLESFGIRGQSRAADFGLVDDNWGGYFKPWAEEIGSAYKQKLKKLCLRRMLVTDEDLKQVAESFSDSLQSLRLHKCLGGFSSLGLYYITSRCRSLKVLFLEESDIQPSESGGRWLTELAQKNHNLEVLNFQCFNTEVEEVLNVDIKDLETLVDNCKSLRTLKVNWEVDVWEMRSLLKRATALTDFGTGQCNDVLEGEPNMFTTADLPKSIVALSGLYYLSDFSVSFHRDILAGLKSLNFQYSSLTEEGLIKMLKHCGSLERLEVRNIVGDEGLITVSESCPRLKRIHVADNFTEEGSGYISPRGIIHLLQGCPYLEHLVMYVADLDNETLACVGKYCSDMKDCRFVLLSIVPQMDDLPLDEGVKALLMGCEHLRRFALYLRHGALTDLGMTYIGMFGKSLSWVLLGCTGDSGRGVINLATGCRSLQKLELRDCPVSETNLAAAADANPGLKFIWAQGQQVAEAGGQILAQCRPDWHVETSLGTPQTPATITAYHSLAKPREDNPPEISIVVADERYLPTVGNGRFVRTLDMSGPAHSVRFSRGYLAWL